MADPTQQYKAEVVAERTGPTAPDPMAASIWTLGQAIAWIVWRTSGKVRQYWNASLVKLSTYEAFADQNEETEQLVSVKTAREELWVRLAEGALTASAIKKGTGCPVQIPAHKWVYLELIGDRNRADGLWFKNDFGKVEYRDITLRRDDICRLWPSHPASKRGRKPGADWDAYYLAFKAKVEADDYPDALNVESWNKQADVERWLAEQAAKDHQWPSLTTIRRHAKDFLEKVHN